MRGISVIVESCLQELDTADRSTAAHPVAARSFKIAVS